jgi:diguanylate cyclase (GGDEF)-like protein
MDGPFAVAGAEHTHATGAQPPPLRGATPPPGSLERDKKASLRRESLALREALLSMMAKWRRAHSRPVSSFSLFPSEDREQGVRFRRFLIAAGTSVLVVLLLGACVLAGVLAPGPFAIATGVILVAIAAFYLAFRFGLNRRARDPSLTIPMMLTAICVVTYALYHLGATRTVFLLIYPVIMFFGVFRLDTRALLLVGTFILCAYTIVVRLLAEQPGGLDPAPIELLRGLVLVTVLTWFSFMGGYVHNLRKRLRESGYDRLTGAYNRGRILDVLAQEKSRCDRGAGPLCVCMVDVDRFKEINDTLGHHAGDQALQGFAQIAREELRAIDFIGRYGGDEFLMVLTQTGLEGARECAERIRGRIAATHTVGSDTHRQLTVSIGVTQHREREPTQDTLRRADAALYRAKTAGRNRVECDWTLSKSKVSGA